MKNKIINGVVIGASVATGLVIAIEVVKKIKSHKSNKKNKSKKRK